MFSPLNMLLITPLLGVMFIKLLKTPHLARLTGMITTILTLYIALYIHIKMDYNNIEYQLREVIDIYNIRITLGVDGISISLIILTTLIMPIFFLLKERTKEEEREITINLLILEFLILVLFSSLDLFVFYVIFELILIPMFLYIGKYGSKEKRIESAYRFLIFSLMGSLIMLISIIMIYIKFGTTNNEILMVKFHLMGLSNFKLLVQLLFFLSFAVKVPIFPFHTWLPFVHVEAPTKGSILLAAIMLKLGGYGLIRYTIGMLGEANKYNLPIIILLSMLSVLYGSLTTIRQIDLKKIVAYSSIVHMNYAIIGLYSNEIEGLIGGNYLMISHAFVSGGLFLLIGILYKRYHTRIILYYNGMVNTMPLFSIVWLLITLANLSLPLTSSFISEIFILISSIKLNLFVGLFLSLSLIFSTTYGFWLTNRLLFGKLTPFIKSYIDLTKNEMYSLFPFLFFTFFLGVCTKPLTSLYTLPVYGFLL